MLCFIGADWDLFGPRKVKTLKGVTMLWPLKLPDFSLLPARLMWPQPLLIYGRRSSRRGCSVFVHVLRVLIA